MRWRVGRSSLAVLFMVAAAVAVGPSPAAAQDDTTTQFWTDFVAAWGYTPGSLLELEVGPKLLTSSGEAWRELTLTPAFEHYPNVRWDLVARTLFSWVDQTDDVSTFEIRPILGFKYYLSPTQSGRWMSRDFNRIENRNIYYRESLDWEATWRYRNRLEYQYSLNNPSITDDKTYYLLVDAELFVNLGKEASERFNDNWRLRAGLGYRQQFGWRLEFLYTLQLSRNTIGQEFDTSNHIFRVRLKHYF